MGRVNDWPERLNDVIDEWRGKKFEWGKTDCASFCAAVDAAINGKPTINMPRYKNKAGAMRQIAKMGPEGLLSYLDGATSRIPIETAVRGDLAAVETQDGPALVIVLGDMAAGMGPDGLVFLPIGAAIAAWRL